MTNQTPAAEIVHEKNNIAATTDMTIEEEKHGAVDVVMIDEEEKRILRKIDLQYVEHRVS